MAVDTGGSAAPGATQWRDGDTFGTYPVEGMTLLDHFAGIAFHSILTDPTALRGVSSDKYAPKVAQASYILARAMIEEKRRLEGLK